MLKKDLGGFNFTTFFKKWNTHQTLKIRQSMYIQFANECHSCKYGKAVSLKQRPMKRTFSLMKAEVPSNN